MSSATGIVEPQARVVSLNDRVVDVAGVDVPWFTSTLVVNVTGIDTLKAKQQLAAISAALSNGTGDERAPFAFRAEVEAYKRTKGTAQQDTAPWRPELNMDDETSVMGIYRQSNNVGGPEANVVVVHSSSPMVAAHLNTMLKQQPTLTVGQFVQTPEHHVARSYAARNMRRIAAAICGALTPYAIGAIARSEPDMRAVPVGANIMGEPLAVPEYYNVTNYFETEHVPSHVQEQHSNRGVLFHAGTVNAATNRSVVQMLDVQQGFIVHTNVPSDAIGVPMSSSLRRFEAEHNTKFVQNKISFGRQQWRDHVQKHYVTIGGAVPSSKSPALWMLEGVDTVSPTSTTTIRLVPLAVAINAPMARKTL